MNRRYLIALLPALAAAACTTTKNGTVTQVHLDMQQVAAWSSAVTTAADVILPLIPAPAPAMTAAKAAVDLVNADLAALSQKYGSDAVLTFDAGSPPAALKSLLADMQQVVSALAAANLGAATDKARPYIAAAQVAVSGFSLVLAAK